MTYLHQTLELITIPRTQFYPIQDITKIRLINNLTNKSYDYVLTDLQEQKISYTLTIDSSNLEVGEHTAQLLGNNDEVIELYLFQVGDYCPNNTEYQTDNETIQYNG